MWRPHLAELTAPVFEEICRTWVRREFQDRVMQVGSWWGHALNELRRSGERGTEEIDVVALDGHSVTVVGECRWRREPMGPDVLRHLNQFKMPALRQSGVRVAPDVQTVLFARAGFTKGLRDDARQLGVQLVSLAQLCAEDGARPPRE
ncbi:MAG TPA: DUF234 domain-containing protein [Candidatus Dormibacteraeota bacterium]|jgi:hypothetical protein|nr:DUF234 domain-containing protein [Candidatus Dormibacteraeota bacterium]